MADIEDIISSAKLPTRTVPLCLRGDLQAEFEDLDRQLQAANANGEDDETLAGRPEVRELAERVEAVRQQMAEHTAVFRFRGLSARDYSDLTAEHKPTEEQQAKGLDLDWETFPVGLIAACAIDPKMTVEQAERLNRTVSDRQWEDLYQAALACNRQRVDVPFSLSASAITAASAPRSSQPERGASPAESSSAGSLAG